MKPVNARAIVSAIIFTVVLQFTNAQSRMAIDQSETFSNAEPGSEQKLYNVPQKRLNFFIQSKPEKPDMLGWSVRMRARIRSLFSKKRLYVIVARNSQEAAQKIEKIVRKNGNRKIGNIWFDSHGHYINAYSSFSVGTDEFCFKNISDSNHTRALSCIAQFCDERTQIGLGSCYAGATFVHPGSSKAPSGPMHGDSLMKGMGKIFPESYIYASESWVMSKPGLFANGYGLAGYPLNKRFRDARYAPVWKTMGIWHRYNEHSGVIETVHTISLNKYGEIRMLRVNYQSLKKAQRATRKNLARLQPGLNKKI